MFIVTARIPKKKLLIGAVTLSCCAVVLAAALLFSLGGRAVTASAEVSNIRNNDDRVAYLTGLGWQVHGDFWDHEYEITDGNRVIAAVSKEWMTWGDAYEIRIGEGVDEVAALAVVLVIDACIEAQRR